MNGRNEPARRTAKQLKIAMALVFLGLAGW